MAQDIVIAGETFNAVPAIQIPKAGGSEIALFTEKRKWIEEVEFGVNFIDWDGTLLYTWPSEEVASKTELPPNPVGHEYDTFMGIHAGMIAQGWNWSLENIKGFMAENPKYKLVVGQLYLTDNNRCRFFIEIGIGDPGFDFGLRVNGSVTIYWGDGTSDVVTGTSESTNIYVFHKYDTPGPKCIEIDGYFVGPGGSSSTGSYFFTKNEAMGSNLTYNHYVRLPRFIQVCNAKLGPASFHTFKSTLGYVLCANATVASNLTFRQASVRTSLVFARLAGFGGQGNEGCYFFGDYISLADTTPVDSTRAFEFSVVQNLRNIPTTRRTVATQYYYSDAIRTLVIPAGVTTAIRFQNSYSATYALLPDSITTIPTNAFANCHSMMEIHLKSQTPPTVANVNAWTNLPTSCVIYVPTGTLEAYRTATNYPDPTVYTYMEE